MHTMARQAADALVAGGGTVLVLSALHGLLPLDEKVEPYDPPGRTRAPSPWRNCAPRRSGWAWPTLPMSSC
ncbi:hypothetical protein ACFWQ1_22500 [Streptomyces albidoflavus]